MERIHKSKNILLVVELGEHLQRTHPEIVELYESQTAHEIARRFSESGGVAFNGSGNITSKTILRNAITTALRGNTNSGFGPVYEGLMEKTKYEELSAEHQYQALKQGRETSLRNKSGLWKASSEDLAGYARASAIARGRTPWTESEVQDARTLSKHPFFRYPEGHRSKGMINYSAVSHALNYLYHEGEKVRYVNSTKQALKRN